MNTVLKKFRICVIVIERNLIKMYKKDVFMKKKIVATIVSCLMIFNISVFAMTTQEFDAGMEKGISYFNQGLYYEAKDEFTWFKDYNYDRMNSGQQKYLDDYLDGAWDRIEQWENSQAETIKLYPGAPSQYECNYHITVEDAIKLIKQRYGVDVTYTGVGNQFFWFEGEGHEYQVERWYPTNNVNAVKIYQIN